MAFAAPVPFSGQVVGIPQLRAAERPGAVHVDLLGADDDRERGRFPVHRQPFQDGGCWW